MSVNQAAAPPPQGGSDPGKRGKGRQLGVIAQSFQLDSSLLSAILAAAESAQVGYSTSAITSVPYTGYMYTVQMHVPWLGLCKQAHTVRSGAWVGSCMVCLAHGVCMRCSMQCM